MGVATIYRDISTLQVEFNAPIAYDPYKKGYYYTNSHWDLALNTISQDDIFYLSAVKILLSDFKNSPFYNEISRVINFVTETKLSPENTILSRIATPPAPGLVIDNELLQNIVTALEHNHIVEFDYIGRWDSPGDTPKSRRVRPYQLVLKDGMYFLFGWDETAGMYFLFGWDETAWNDEDETPAGGERLFFLPNISRLRLTGDTFELPKNYDFTQKCSGSKLGVFISSQVDRYEIEFYGSARPYIKSFVWVENQEITDIEERDATQISFTSSQYLPLLEWVLSQGKNAKPLAPQWFVDRWKHGGKCRPVAAKTTKTMALQFYRTPIKSTRCTSARHTSARCKYADAVAPPEVNTAGPTRPPAKPVGHISDFYQPSVSFS